MKVLHVIPSLAAIHGGPSKALPLIERSLGIHDIIVETATTNDDGNGQFLDRSLDRAIEENGVTRWYFPKQTEFYKISRPFTKWLKRNIVRYEVVHVHALFSYTSVNACRIARSSRVPYIVRPLGLLNRYGMKNRRPFLKALSLKYLEGPLLKKAAAIHFTSVQEKSEAEMLRIPFESIVIPLGLESLELSSSDSSGKSFVLFLSRLDPKKNIEGLLHAWAEVSGRFPNWRLVVAGSGSAGYEKKLKAIAETLEIGGLVDWPGHVTGDTKRQLLADAQIFTLPSYSENFGIAAAEALLAGKACVFTDGVAVGKVAGDQGAAVISKADPQSLSCSLISLIQDENRRQELSKAAKRFAAKELSAETMGRRLKVLYESVVARKQTS